MRLADLLIANLFFILSWKICFPALSALIVFLRFAPPVEEGFVDFEDLNQRSLEELRVLNLLATLSL